MSIVRDNLMSDKDYTPYCGSNDCVYRWPRLVKVGDQFRCACGYQTEFPADFITEYKAKWEPTNDN